MSEPYVIAPLGKVKGENAYPGFEEMLKDLQDAAIARAEKIWSGWKFGGILPGDKEFGIAPLRAREMANDVSATTLSGTYSYRKNLGSTGWYTLFDYSVRDDILHAFAGFKVTDDVLRLLQFRMEIYDKKLPIIDVQAAKGWGEFAILFKVDEGKELIAEPRHSVYVRGYVEATGYQTIVPLGFQLYKTKNLVISES